MSDPELLEALRNTQLWLDAAIVVTGDEADCTPTGDVWYALCDAVGRDSAEPHKLAVTAISRFALASIIKQRFGCRTQARVWRGVRLDKEAGKRAVRSA